MFIQFATKVTCTWSLKWCFQTVLLEFSGWFQYTIYWQKCTTSHGCFEVDTLIALNSIPMRSKGDSSQGHAWNHLIFRLIASGKAKSGSRVTRGAICKPQGQTRGSRRDTDLWILLVSALSSIGREVALGNTSRWPRNDYLGRHIYKEFQRMKNYLHTGRMDWQTSFRQGHSWLNSKVLPPQAFSFHALN